MTLLATSLTAWADRNPDFDDDAKPILRMQPGLLAYVEDRFEVKDTGIAKVPGDDDRHAQPPYIFQAKPRGYPGAYYLTMLIQPGNPGHILKIVDPTKPNGGASQHGSAPTSYNSAPSSSYAQSAPTNTPSSASITSQASTPAKAPAQPKTSPTADTPSGPLTSNSPSLEPPPDPAPATH